MPSLWLGVERTSRDQWYLPQHCRLGGAQAGMELSNRTKGCCCCWWFAILAVLAILLYISILGSVITSYRFSKDLRMTPGDSRLVEFPSRFFSSLKLYYSDDLDAPVLINATLYLVDKVPTTIPTNRFKIVDTFTIFGQDYLFWQFYFYKGSNFSFLGCVTNGSGYFVSIVKGTDNFKRWIATFDVQYTVYKLYITLACPKTVSIPTFTADSDDNYYFVYHTNDSHQVSANITQTFERYQLFDIEPYSLSHCIINNSHPSCQISVPYSGQWNKLVVVTGEHPSDVWDSHYTVIVNGSPRLSILGPTMAVCTIVLVTCQIIFTTLAVCSGMYYCHKSSRYQLMSGHRSKIYSTFDQQQDDEYTLTTINPIYST